MASYRLRRWAIVVLLASAWWASSATLHAQESQLVLQWSGAEQRAGRRYAEVPEPRYARAVLENLGVFALGLAYYYKDRAINSVDWEYRYEWATLESKLIGDGYSFDNNYFNTNYIAHPGAGALYYLTARSNHLGLYQSLGFTIGASTLWEFVGEFRERVSVNDTFVTPLGGFAFGESMAQLGGFFSRSCRQELRTWLGGFFAPFGAIHDAVDGASPRVATRCDEHGLPQDGGHRLGAELTGGAFHIDSPGAASGGVLSGRVQAELWQLDGFGKPGHEWRGFADGEVSQLELEASVMHDSVRGVRVTARDIAAGLHYRRLGPAGARPSGRELVLGAGAGMEYGLFRYGGTLAPIDPTFILEAPALLLLWIQTGASYRFEAGTVMGPVLAGVGPFALDDYLARFPDARLTSVAEAHRYNHALGVSVSPRLSVVTDSLEVSLTGRSDALFVVRALDGDTRLSSPIPVEEYRRRARLVIAVGRSTGARGVLSFEATSRRGVMGDVVRHASQVGFTTGLQWRY